MRQIPWWAVLSSIGAPVLLIGGWRISAALQPASYDANQDTISALAGHGATDRWVMTAAIVGLGICHAATAAGLRPAGWPGRLTLALGGVATVAVSTLPLPARGTSEAHGRVALFAFVALAVWPALGVRSSGPVALRKRTGVTATVVLLFVLGWFGVSLQTGHLVGLSERFAAGAEAFWPMLVVVSVVSTSAHARSRARQSALG